MWFLCPFHGLSFVTGETLTFVLVFRRKKKTKKTFSKFSPNQVHIKLTWISVTGDLAENAVCVVEVNWSLSKVLNHTCSTSWKLALQRGAPCTVTTNTHCVALGGLQYNIYTPRLVRFVSLDVCVMSVVTGCLAWWSCALGQQSAREYTKFVLGFAIV